MVVIKPQLYLRIQVTNIGEDFVINYKSPRQEEGKGACYRKIRFLVDKRDIEK